MFASALERPGGLGEKGSLRPSLAAAARDLRAAAEFLEELVPGDEPCDVTLAALAERCADPLRPLIHALEEAASASAAPPETISPPETRTS